jgi:hypothetical protein
MIWTTLLAASGLTLGNLRAAEQTLPTRIVVRAEHEGWGSRATNLTLVWTNGVYAAPGLTVAPASVSNLLVAARRPWPLPPSNSWPHFTIDVANLGLDTAWLRTNYERLLRSFGGQAEQGIFPNASERQRQWLTNALGDIGLLGEAIRGGFGSLWTDDYPSLEVRFEQDTSEGAQLMLRLFSRAQQPFMLPWNIQAGTNETTSGNAGISRSVAQMLPPGFMHRERLQGDLLRMIVDHFQGLKQVQEFMKGALLEETLGRRQSELLSGYDLGRCGLPPSGSGRFPETFMATLHRTNWPSAVLMPVQTGIKQGVITNFQTILSTADIKLDHLVRHKWLIARASSSSGNSIEVKAEGSPDHPWLRGQMEKAGRAAFYDQVQPALSRSVGLLLREGRARTSEWALLDDGRLLLYGFTGDGVLDWKPEDLGFKGDPGKLSVLINRVGVFVGPEGGVSEVVLPEK